MYIWNQFPTRNVRFTNFIWRNDLFRENRKIFANIYVINYVPLLQLIYIGWIHNNIQNSMLAYSDNKNLSIHNYY